jgi:putative membrane protein
MIIVHFVLSAIGFVLMTRIVPGITIETTETAILLALLWGMIDMSIRPLIRLLALPINIFTLETFTFIINGFLLALLGGLVTNFQVQGFWVAVLGAMVLSVFSLLIDWKFGMLKSPE